jgi:carbonic anhydrase
LARLLEGNNRFAADQSSYPHQDMARRAEIVAGQNPFAIVLTCADSRVPPEILFDQGLGDLFVVRTAGNVVDEIALGSIEYAVAHLQVPLLLVLGHQGCGAVTAATGEGAAEGHIAAIVSQIAPAVSAARELPGDLVANAIDLNIRRVAADLAASEPILAAAVAAGQLAVVAARYDLDRGLMQVFEG